MGKNLIFSTSLTFVTNINVFINRTWIFKELLENSGHHIFMGSINFLLDIFKFFNLG